MSLAVGSSDEWEYSPLLYNCFKSRSQNLSQFLQSSYSTAKALIVRSPQRNRWVGAQLAVLLQARRLLNLNWYHHDC
ncbi:MAG TPA: hypothetical protein V6D34_00405 [Candidatus Sericytochromatia bacterium]